MKIEADTIVILPSDRITTGEKIERALALETRMLHYVECMQMSSCILDWHSTIFEYENTCPYNGEDCDGCPYYEGESNG